jgi:hypothetical protein
MSSTHSRAVATSMIVKYRSISSTALSVLAGSALIIASCSGLRRNAMVDSEIMFAVVSWPATSSRMPMPASDVRR